MRKLDRNIAIAGGVVLLHAAGLWALQAGLVRRAAEILVPVRILTEMVAPPEPQVEPPQLPPPRQQVEPVKRPAPRKVERAPPAPKAKPQPQPQPQQNTIPAPPAPEAPLSVVTPEPAAAPAAAPASPAETRAGAPAGAVGTGKVELPSSDASYLGNPAPVYPTISKRLGEQGKVIVRVLIGRNGLPERAELKRSSGYERLDRAALDYVMKCRYVPGKVGGEPQAMWYEAPVNFVLE